MTHKKGEVKNFCFEVINALFQGWRLPLELDSPSLRFDK
jgi:hypothetical protein